MTGLCVVTKLELVWCGVPSTGSDIVGESVPRPVAAQTLASRTFEPRVCAKRSTGSGTTTTTSSSRRY